MIGGWHVEAEIVSAIIIIILLVYSKESNMVPSLKNKTFRWCLWVFCIAIFSNIASTFLVSTGEFLLLTNVVTLLYYLITPFMTVIYFLYVITVIQPNTKMGVKKLFILHLIIYAVYAIIVLTNPIHKAIYSYDGIYIRGSLNWLTYLVAFLYTIILVIIIAINSKRVATYERRVLYLFPIIGTAIVVVQMLFPLYTLSGLGAAVSALILYLYLQNKQKNIDSLTMLSNRNVYINILKYKIAKQDNFFAVFIAVADFKYINDKFGDKVGDQLLIKIADYLKDTIGSKYTYRNNGAKFTLILESDTKIEEVLKKLADRFKESWPVSEYNLMVRIGISYAENFKLKTRIEDMISALEYSVALSKYKNTSDYEECNKEMLGDIAQKHYILEVLKEEIDCNGFVVYYQPLMSTKTNTFANAEALLRLYDKKAKKMIYPDEFIPVAEESGLIIDIGYLVLEKVCQFIRNLLNNDQQIECISVNVSVLQFMQTDLSEKIIAIIDKYNIPHSMIKLELTESVFALSYATLHDTIIKLSESNIKFALDDFGTGFSNIAYFIGLPFDFVKIDKSLVWGSIDDKRMANLLEYLINGFTKIGLRIIVEGVETQEQDDFVRKCGCEFIQGYLYAKPMPAEEAYLCLIGNV